MNRISILSWLLIASLVMSSISIQAQEAQKTERGKITGRIVDSLTAQPIEYATVGLMRQADGKLVNGATADSKGNFHLLNVEAGIYTLLADFIGYRKYSLENIAVSKENPNIVLQDVKLAGRQKTLKEVTITEEKNIIENKIDKLVYNADKDITSQNGLAEDVLKKVPEVTVDADGQVELQGSASVKILINGKPSILFGSSITEVLQSIPASQIQSIEVITSPGAKYDAEGIGGIINIILKKNNAQGINGNISLSAGTRLENGSINLHARKKKFGIHAFLNGNAQVNSTTVNRMNRMSWDSTSASQLLQTGTSNFMRNGYEAGIGFDWEISPKDNLGGSLSYDYFGNKNSGSTNRRSMVSDVSGNTLSDVEDVVGTSNKFHEHSLDYELVYLKKFKKEDQELEIAYSASNGNNYSHYEQMEQHSSSGEIFSGSRGNNPVTDNETNVTVNYSHPVSEDFTVETGGKAELSHMKSVSDIYLLNTLSNNYEFNEIRSYGLTYNRNVYAAYLSASYPLFEILELKTGARYEYTEASADFSNWGNITFKPYCILVPSIIVSHKFRNEQTLKASYTRRIERPDYEDMNPFINATDPKNIVTGNPSLIPETGDKIELGFSKSFATKTTINVSFFLRNNKDDIQSYTRYYPVYKIGDSIYTDVSVQTWENIGRENNYGISLFASIPVTEKINVRANISGFERYIFSDISSVADVRGFNYKTNMNLSCRVSETLILELFGNFNSPKINAQGTKPAFSTYSFAFRKQLFHTNASIALTATNFFKECINQETKLTGDNFTLVNARQLPYRSFGFNFTYKFGRLEFGKERESEDVSPANPLPPGE